MLPMLKEYFEGKTLREMSAQSVEKFKNDRMNTPTKRGQHGNSDGEPRANSTQFGVFAGGQVRQVRIKSLQQGGPLHTR